MKVSIKKCKEIAKRLISNDLPILIESGHGAGKTAIILEIVKELDLTIKYFSASTLDPFADLVGIPYPLNEENRRTLEYLRHASIMDAEVLFFDEFNRAHEKVTNALMEIIQFGSINGEKLKNLKTVVAAINPSDGEYHTNEMDPAVVDRFYAYVEVDGKPSKEWFKENYQEYGTAVIDWWTLDLSKAEKARISPRKLEHIVQLSKLGINPTGMYKQLDGISFGLYMKRLDDAKNPMPDIEDFIKEPEYYQELMLMSIDTVSRFAQLVNVMTVEELYKCKEYFLIMPPESVPAILIANEKKFMKLKEYMLLNDGKLETDAYLEILKERYSNVS